jgi:hypothetical protein
MYPLATGVGETDTPPPRATSTPRPERSKPTAGAKNSPGVGTLELWPRPGIGAGADHRPSAARTQPTASDAAPTPVTMSGITTRSAFFNMLALP